MSSPPPPRSGMFVVSAWVEPDAVPPVRARIRYTPDVEDQSPTVVVVATLDDACTRLRDWWEALEGR